MKITVLKNDYFKASLLVLIGFILYTAPYTIPDSIKVFTVFLQFISLAPLFYMVIKYKYRAYAPCVIILLLSSIFFFNIASIGIVINLLIPVLIFKRVFKDFKFTSCNKTYYALLTY